MSLAPEVSPPKTFADAEALLATALPGYEPREPQQVLAQRIEAIFGNADNFTEYKGEAEDYPDWERPGISHLLGQAGCGTGKSLAYLIPALLSDRRVIVSVTTKALQDQIVTTDLPFLETHLGLDFRWALLKGRSNYLCLNRLEVMTEGEAPVEVLRAIWDATQRDDFTGQREEISGDIPDQVWRQVASESEECSSNQCKSDKCFAARAREYAASCQIVIANHSLFLSDLKIKSLGIPGMLGEYDLVIFDEAHTLEEVAGNVLGASLSHGTFGAYAAQVRRWGTQYADDEGNALMEPLADLGRASTLLFDRLEEGRLRTGQLNALVEEFAALYGALDTLWVRLKAATYEQTKDGTRAGKRRLRLIRQTLNLIERVREVVAAPADEMVRWVEMERRKQGTEWRTVPILKTAPILVSPFLRKWLFNKTPTVLVSATLAVRGHMHYIAGRLGIAAYDEIDVGTPFDFAEQARIYVPAHLPIPTGRDQAAWAASTQIEIHRLVTASRGRALVLFTSIKHMKDTLAALEMMGGDLTYRMQGERGVTNADLIGWLKDHETGGPGRVLLATKSFFTGIDVQGDALSLVIITKMPFPVPTEPLTEARCEAIEAAGGSAFADYTIPVMSLELQQGIGRLIRHRGDKGVAAVLDPRLVTKSYGKQILRDLPPMPLTVKLEDAGAFLSSP